MAIVVVGDESVVDEAQATEKTRQVKKTAGKNLTRVF
jgi:hypothetical protein